MIGFLAAPQRVTRKKGTRRAFTPEEDAALVEVVTNNPLLGWKEVAKHLAGRTPRQCRERWAKYLTPDVRVAPWTEDEDVLLLRQIELHGHQWTKIACAFANRSDNDIKNRWYSHLKDCLYMTPDGRLDLRRDADGNRIHSKAKRKREHISAGIIAFQALGRRTFEGIDRNRTEKPGRVQLPQLCSPPLQRLRLPDLPTE